MAFKLAIGNRVGVKVKGTVRDERGADKPFKFVLVCDRLTNDELQAVVTSGANGGEPIKTDAFFLEHAKDWRDQDLVVDEEGHAAPFSEEALRALFTISGMAGTCWLAYMEQAVATAKN